MVRSVSVKPRAVCSVSMVPTQARSDSSAIDAENCAESATMATPQTRHSATSHDRVAAEEEPHRRRAAAAHRHRHDGDRRAAEAVGEEAGADRADGPGRDRRERRELGRHGTPRRPAASARSSRRKRRRSTPTSHRAPTCARGSRGWRGAAGRRARPWPRSADRTAAMARGSGRRPRTGRGRQRTRRWPTRAPAGSASSPRPAR